MTLTAVCQALYDAQAIISELQPAPFAHLEKKVGVLGTTQRGWGDGLGWGQDGPLSTALRLIPRFFNSLLSPLSYFSRIPLPSYLKSGEKAPKRVKISRTRRGKIDQLYALLDEAEQAGCDDVYGVRANLRMVRYSSGWWFSGLWQFPPKGIKQDLLGAYAAYEVGRWVLAFTSLTSSAICKSNPTRNPNSWSDCSTPQVWVG